MQRTRCFHPYIQSLSRSTKIRWRKLLVNNARINWSNVAWVILFCVKVQYYGSVTDVYARGVNVNLTPLTSKRGALATDARGCSLWRSLLEHPPPTWESWVRDLLGTRYEFGRCGPGRGCYSSVKKKCLKGIVTQKWKLCHLLLTLMLFQTVRPSFVFGTQIKIFLMKSESFLTLNRKLPLLRLRKVMTSLK